MGWADYASNAKATQAGLPLMVTTRPCPPQHNSSVIEPIISFLQFSAVVRATKYSKANGKSPGLTWIIWVLGSRLVEQLYCGADLDRD
jgi:hypothetical protein